jgi:Secretion system C-terminal sorting domain
MVGFGMLGTDQFVTAGMFNKRLDFDPTGSSTILQTDMNGSFYEFDHDLFIAKYGFGGSTHVGDGASVSSLTLYPNPFQTQLHVGQHAGHQSLRVRIYDAQGKLVASASPDLRGSIHTADLPAGFYTVEILSGSSQRDCFKMVKVGNSW